MFIIADPDNFYLNDLSQSQFNMLQEIKYDFIEHHKIYDKYMYIINQTIEIGKYRISDRFELNEIRKYFLIYKKNKNFSFDFNYDGEIQGKILI